MNIILSKKPQKKPAGLKIRPKKFQIKYVQKNILPQPIIRPSPSHDELNHS